MKRKLSIFLLTAFAFAGLAAAAEEHIVPADELEASLEAAAETRRSNEADIERLVAHEEVADAARAAGVDPEQVRQAIPRLDDETLAELAARARELDKDVAGGFVGGILIMLILILLLAVLISVYVID
jgi:hypothetical protein